MERDIGYFYQKRILKSNKSAEDLNITNYFEHTSLWSNKENLTSLSNFLFEKQQQQKNALLLKTNKATTEAKSFSKTFKISDVS